MEARNREFVQMTYPDGRPIPPDTLRVLMGRFVETFLNPGTLFNLLQTHGAIIAGGYPLSVISHTDLLTQDSRGLAARRLDSSGPFHNTDVDIYVPNRNVVAFLADFHRTVSPISWIDITHSSWYCRSFLRMNKIRRIYRFSIVQGDQTLSFDIMAVRRTRTPQQVVANFDLTFCQIYYDGQTLYATDPDHIWNKRGYLQKDYVKLLFEGNRFLQQRMLKYKNRGFTITPEPGSEAVLELRANLKEPQCRRLDEPNGLSDWLKHQIFYMMLYKDSYYENTIYIPAFSPTQKKTQWGSQPIHGFKVNVPQSNRGAQNRNRFLRLLPDDGYDSDDYDTFDKLETLGQQTEFPTMSIQGRHKHVYAAIKKLWNLYQQWLQVILRKLDYNTLENLRANGFTYQIMRPFQLYEYLQQYVETEMPAQYAAAEGLQNVERRLTALGSAALDRPNAPVLPTNVMRQIAAFTGNRRGLRGAMGVRNEPLNENLGAVNVEGLRNLPNPVTAAESNQNRAIRRARQQLMNLTGRPAVPPAPDARRTRKNRQRNRRNTRVRR